MYVVVIDSQWTYQSFWRSGSTNDMSFLCSRNKGSSSKSQHKIIIPTCDTFFNIIQPDKHAKYMLNHSKISEILIFIKI